MDVDKNYIKLSQSLNILKNYSRGKNCLSSILKNDFDINYGVPANSLFGKRKPEFTGYTLLHFAVEYKSYEAIDILLQHHADISCKALNGFTPLRLAFEHMKDCTWMTDTDRKYNYLHQIVNKLLLAHISQDNKTNPKCPNGITHFHMACVIDINVADFFIKKGVDVNETVNINSLLFPGFSPLHFAIRYGHLELVSKLLKCGAHVNHLDGLDMTPLKLLVDYNMQINDFLNMGCNYYKKIFEESKYIDLKINDQVMEMLMTSMESSCSNPVDEFGFTFLHASCTRQNQDFIERLVELNANINAPVKLESPLWPGYTPLHFAARCNLQIVMLLLKKGANLTAKDANGITALDLCIDRYTAADISCILKSQAVGFIRFGNNASLANVFLMMDLDTSFEKFLSVIEIDACVSLDSPVWPGYSLLHLAVLMSRTKRRFQRKFFVIKNYLWDKNISASSDSMSIVKMYLKKNSNMLFRDANGMTPLRLAFHLKKSEILRACLCKYIDSVPWTIGHDNLKYLHEALAVDCFKIVENLFKNGLDPNWTIQKDEVWYCDENFQKDLTFKAGSTMLHIAALAEANFVVMEFLDLNVEISIPDADGLTPLQLGFLHSKSTRILCNLSRVPRAQKINSTTKSNLTHLHIACYIGNKEAVEKLLEVTSNVNEQIICDSSDPYVETLAKYEGYTPLHFAVELANEQITQLLIQKGANIFTKNAKGLSPLHMALKNLRGYNMTKYIIEEAINKENFQDDFGITRLHLAYFINDKNLIENFVKAGENVNSQIKLDSTIYPGDTPFHFLIRSYLWGNGARVFQLINDKFDLSLKNSDGLTPLLLLNSTYAKGLKGRLFPSIMKRAFCSILDTNNEGLSHLHITCYMDEAIYVKECLTSGADCNAAIDYFNDTCAGYTPLHIAVRRGNRYLIKTLLQHGADPLVQDSYGRTPLFHAADNRLFDFAYRSIIQMQCFSPNSLKDDLQTCDVFGDNVFKKIFNCYNYNFNGLSWVLKNYDGNINFMNASFYNLLMNLIEIRNCNLAPLLIEKKIDLTVVNEKGHNILFLIIEWFKNSTRLNSSTTATYINNLEALVTAGCELDHQDCNGRTALHQSVLSHKRLGVRILLAIGADINICDKKKQVSCNYIKNLKSFSSINEMFEDHILKMSEAGLYLNKSNKLFLEDCTVLEPSKFRTEILLALSKMEKDRVNEQLFVRDLLTERLVQKFPYQIELKRQTILELLGSNKLVEKYPEWRGLFRLQRRRMLASLMRVNLLKTAARIFQDFTGLPLLCIDIIFGYLSNEDLKKWVEI